MVEYCGHALEIRKNECSAGVVVDLNNLGLAKWQLGQLEKVVKYFDRALKVCEKV